MSGSRRPASSTCAFRRLARGAAWTRPRPPAPTFGRVRPEPPLHVNVEFVSANPTGPLTVGNARGAFVGDLLCRVLEGGGHRVTREYYFNDSGRQVRILGASVAARRLGEPLPEEAYRGGYVDELAAALPDRRLGARPPPPARTATPSSATGRGAESATASRPAWSGSASTSTSGRARPACTTRAGSSAPSSALRDGGPRLRAGRRHLVPLDDLRRRQGPRHLPLQRRAHLLRLGHRLRQREVQPRLRQAHLRLGRRPPRHGGPRAQRGARPWASTRTPSRCSWWPGCASCATAWRSR